MSMRPTVWTGLLCVLLLAVYWPTAGHAAEPDEYSVKAAFMYNIARFTQWPDEQSDSTDSFVFCVYGDDPFGPALDSLSGKSIKRTTLTLQRLRRGSELHNCHVVFISESERLYLKRILEVAASRPILTISDIPEFVAAGGMVGLVQNNSRLAFDINVRTAEAAQLKISSQLLNLARNVVKAP